MTSAIHAFGESALLVEIGEGIDDAHVARARAVADGWEALGHGLAVPTYTSVLLRYDPFTLDPRLAEREAGRLVETATPAPAASFRTIEIPTTYEGPDLEETAERSHLAVDELIALHADRDYRVLFLGFLPGFAYCGTLDPRIAAPRLARPREHVPAGAVAIADGQTGVYPFDSPGGWRLIGRTELRMFDPSHAPAALVRAGDRVRFVRR